MHLLIGDPQDSCCVNVRDALEASGHPTRIISNPLVYPSRLEWRLNNEQSASRLVWEEEPPVLDDHIAGVLVRNIGWVDPIGWQKDDFTYMQAETYAALLAWLWSLRCPVVNRYSSSIWYNPQTSLLSWQRLLRRCGLPTLETLLTNVEQEARAFGRSLAQEGVAGVVYAPLTSPVRYLITGDKEWSGLAAMQSYAPVCLAYPHGQAQSVCVVGEHVVWEGEPSPETAMLEQPLRRFAALAGLAFVELALALTPKGVCVIAVEPHPHFERFGDAARQQIVEELVYLLTAEERSSQTRATQTVQRSAR